jgi:hypothetical protein
MSGIYYVIRYQLVDRGEGEKVFEHEADARHLYNQAEAAKMADRPIRLRRGGIDFVESVELHECNAPGVREAAAIVRAGNGTRIDDGSEFEKWLDELITAAPHEGNQING